MSQFCCLLDCCRTLRFVPEGSKDKMVSDEDVLQTLLKTFTALFVNDLRRQTFLLSFLPKVKSKYLDLQKAQPETNQTIDDSRQNQIIFNPEDVLLHTLGFSITRRHSSLISAGTGVFVTKGFVPKGAVVSMYPGMERMYLQIHKHTISFFAESDH